MIYFVVILVVIALVVLWMLGAYNSLVSLRNKVRDQWSQIDVLLKRRSDLIPNLVETVKGYAGHESSTLEAVIAARNKVVAAPSKEEEMRASGELTGALNRLFALAESYPELKANTNFLDLQNSLQGTEDKISYAIQFYNDAVMKYQNKIEMFPTNIVAGMFNFKPEKFFEATEAEKEAPKVEF